MYLGKGDDGEIASEYKHVLDCLGTYDTLSEIGKRKREFVCQGAGIKLRLIVLRTCTCGVISQSCHNKLDVAERGEGGPKGEGPGERSGRQDPSRGFHCRSSRNNKVQFYCRSAGRERALSLPVSNLKNICIYIL